MPSHMAPNGLREKKEKSSTALHLKKKKEEKKLYKWATETYAGLYAHKLTK